MNSKNMRRGFTLVELLVVCLILSILTAYAVPGYLSTEKDSRTKTAAANIRIMARAIQADYIKNGALSYSSYSSSAVTLAMANILSDLGGSIPTNPCDGTGTTADYTIAVSGGGTGLNITALNTGGKCSSAQLIHLGS